jgi:hypothetical protein
LFSSNLFSFSFKNPKAVITKVSDSGACLMTLIDPSLPSAADHTAIQQSLFEVFEFCAPSISGCLQDFSSQFPNQFSDVETDAATEWIQTPPSAATQARIRQVS